MNSGLQIKAMREALAASERPVRYAGSAIYHDVLPREGTGVIRRAEIDVVVCGGRYVFGLDGRPVERPGRGRKKDAQRVPDAMAEYVREIWVAAGVVS